MYIMPLYTRLKSLPGTTLVGYCRPIKPVFITLLVLPLSQLGLDQRRYLVKARALLQSSDFTSFFFDFMATVRLYCLWNCWWIVLTYGVFDRHPLLWVNLCFLMQLLWNLDSYVRCQTLLCRTQCILFFLGKNLVRSSVSDPPNCGCVLYTESKIKKTINLILLPSVQCCPMRLTCKLVSLWVGASKSLWLWEASLPWVNV